MQGLSSRMDIYNNMAQVILDTVQRLESTLKLNTNHRTPNMLHVPKSERPPPVQRSMGATADKRPTGQVTNRVSTKKSLISRMPTDITTVILDVSDIEEYNEDEVNYQQTSEYCNAIKATSSTNFQGQTSEQRVMQNPPSKVPKQRIYNVGQGTSMKVSSSFCIMYINS